MRTSFAQSLVSLIVDARNTKEFQDVFMVPTIEIFCCYAHEDQELLHHLKTHLMPLQWQGLITIWNDTDINAGLAWEREIEAHLDTAHIILLLISPDFMASEYCYSKEMRRAMQRHEQREARVIPIILRPIIWTGTPFETLQALPTDAKAVTDQSWHTEDEAFYEVAEHISNVVKELRIQLSFAEASKLFKGHRYEEALIIYDQVIHLEPNSVLANLGKGEALLALERYEESLIEFEKARQGDATVANGGFYYNKALALQKLQRYEDSLAAYDEATHLDPASSHSYSEKVEVLLHLRRFPEVFETYEQLIRLEPSKAEHFQRKGDLLLQTGHPEQALEAYEKAISLKPEQAQYYNKKSEILLGLKKFEDALAALEEAIRLEPKKAKYFSNKGRVLLCLERFDDALSVYEICLNLDLEENPYHYHGKGQALFGLARYDEALAAYEQAISFDAPHPDPQFYYDKGRVYECLARQAYILEKQAYLHWEPKWRDDQAPSTALRAAAFTLLRTFTRHTSGINGIAFSPDGQMLASGSNDKTIKLWGVN